MTKQRLHTATIVLGLFTALMVVLSQVVFFENTRYSVKESKAEKQEQKKEKEEKKGDQAYLTISSRARNNQPLR